MLLSLFSGPGGLDLGFERAGFEIGLAFDKNEDCVRTYNANRTVSRAIAHCRDVQALEPSELDKIWGSEFAPVGLIGGPPCQSFSKANSVHVEDDPRHSLPFAYARLLRKLNARNPIDFFAFENVPGLLSQRHKARFTALRTKFREAGFEIACDVLSATDYKTPQKRSRLFIVGINQKLSTSAPWEFPLPTTDDGDDLTVRGAIGSLPEPTFFVRGLRGVDISHHPNHWCMRPNSAKFTRVGALTPGDGRNRSFKTLSWDKSSLTVAYGHREVHIHPRGSRRLSVYEAMKLQGFPHNYVLQGTLSSQITQVSDAVPPLVAEAVAVSLKRYFGYDLTNLAKH